MLVIVTDDEDSGLYGLMLTSVDPVYVGVRAVKPQFARWFFANCDEPPWAVVSESLAAASSVAELCQTRPCLVYWIGDDAPAGYPTHTQTFPPTAEGSEQLMRAISSSHEAGVGPLKLAGERGVCVGSGRDIIDSGPLGVLVSAYPRPVETGWSGAGGLNSALRKRGLKWRISRSAGHLVLKEVIEP
jgi:hypothetical protein